MKNSINIKCPYCGSGQGYYMLEKVHRFLAFDFMDEPDGASEDITDYSGRRKYCANCHRILPKRMFEEN